MRIQKWVIYPHNVKKVRNIVSKLNRIDKINELQSIYNQCDVYECVGSSEQLNTIMDLHLVEGY